MPAYVRHARTAFALNVMRSIAAAFVLFALSPDSAPEDAVQVDWGVVALGHGCVLSADLYLPLPQRSGAPALQQLRIALMHFAHDTPEVHKQGLAPELLSRLIDEEGPILFLYVKPSRELNSDSMEWSASPAGMALEHVGANFEGPIQIGEPATATALQHIWQRGSAWDLLLTSAQGEQVRLDVPPMPDDEAEVYLAVFSSCGEVLSARSARAAEVVEE